MYTDLLSSAPYITDFTLTYHGLILINGIGAQVKKTVISRKDFLP